VGESSERQVFLSTAPVTDTDRRLALWTVGVSAVFFVASAPFARVALPEVPAFVASYQSALAVNDLVTAVLLAIQFRASHSRALLALAGGYLFTAIIAVAHALTFPGLFAPAGLLGAGPQTTVWLYMIWHAGLPAAVAVYAFGKDRETSAATQEGATATIATVAAAVVLLAVAAATATTAGHAALPILLEHGRYTWTMIAVVTFVWSLSFCALLLLWFRRPHSVLDVWLMVVLCVWLFDIALSAVLNAGRFDLGFYVGRLYGLLAASFVLVVLLFQTGTQQGQLMRLLTSASQRAESERHRHAQALDQEIEERRRIFETSQDLILVTDSKGNFIQVSPSSTAILGYRPDELVGRSALGFISPDDLESTRTEMRLARSGQQMRNFETRYVHKDGRVVTLTWMGVWSEPVQRHFFIGRDMTDSRRARDALAESERMARGIIDTALDAFVQMDEKGLITGWNPQAEKIFGWQREEALGKSLGELIVPEAHRARHHQGLARFLSTGENAILDRRFEIDAQARDGRIIKVELSITAFRRRGGFLFNGFIRDLTEKIAAEDRFRQAQKMEAVGQLTGGIAHDFNNILTVITGTIEILADAVADRPQLAAIAKMIDEAAERGADLTRHLLAFARKQPLQPRETDVNELLLEASKLLRPTLGEHIEIESMLDETVSRAMVDPNQLTTAILNLALNARDAMPAGGKLTLETRNVMLDENYAAAHSEVTPGTYVLIAVSDTGQGIPAHLIEKVIEPFFTTKDVGKGTGLGLSMVYGLVKQSNGHIKIYSEEGHGTSVKMYLPLAAAASDTAPAREPERLEGGHETVLVVEDDDLVRNYVIAQVQSLGYATLSASNATQAIAVLDNVVEVDLLFTDVIMPGAMNGRELVEIALKKRPALAVLYTSGYTENAIVHHGRLDPGVLLLAKPYRKADLARMIRKALAATKQIA
jgi:PAS domain S-box-containing protein